MNTEGSWRRSESLRSQDHGGRNCCVGEAAVDHAYRSNAIHEHPRNKYDSELKALADKGGVVGLYLMPYLGGAPNQPSKDLVMQHLEHVLKVCGEDHVGIGTDGGIEKVEMTAEQEKAFKEDVAQRKAAGVSAPEEDRYPYVPDFNGPRKFELIAGEIAEARI